MLLLNNYIICMSDGVAPWVQYADSRCDMLESNPIFTHDTLLN